MVGRVDPDGTDAVKVISDFSAGFGDMISFGGSGLARRALAEELFGPEVGDPADTESGGYAAGEIGGLVWSCASGVAVPARLLGVQTRIGLHGAHHHFPRFGRRLPHIQLNAWRQGVKGSGKSYRLPIPWK